jgi:hypothetical protein
MVLISLVRGVPSRLEKAIPAGVKTAISPSSRKTISRVWERMAGISEATKYSPCP